MGKEELRASGQSLRASGQCLCGGVRYEVRGPLRAVLECHCPTCRRFSGGLWQATSAYREHVIFTEQSTLKWYQSSEHVKRGFCGDCGSSLFWNREDRPYLGIAAGTLNQPTGLKLAARIFTAHPADYDKIGQDIPVHPDGNHGQLIPES